MHAHKLEQCREEFEGHLDYDLGNLMASDPSAQDLQALREDSAAFCIDTATRIMQSLAGQLFRLPGRNEGLGRIVDLPSPAFPLPRQKPLPTPRPPTRLILQKLLRLQHLVA